MEAVPSSEMDMKTEPPEIHTLDITEALRIHEEQIRRHLEDHKSCIKAMLEEQEAQNKARHEHMIQLLQNTIETIQNAKKPETHLYERPEGFPISTMEEFNDFEKDVNMQRRLLKTMEIEMNLNWEEFKVPLKCDKVKNCDFQREYLTFVGGLSVREALNQFMKESITDSLVQGFCWTRLSMGTHKTMRPFYNTKLARVLFDAVNQCQRLESCDRVSFANHMKEVLRTAKQRGRDLQKRRNKEKVLFSRKGYLDEMNKLYPSEEETDNVILPTHNNDLA